MTRASTSILLLASLEDSDRKGGGIIRPKVVRCQGRIVRGTAPDFARDRGRRKKNEREKGREMKNERKNGKAVLGNK